jgi:DNA-binding NarL/FixJ family response regulator
MSAEASRTILIVDSHPQVRASLKDWISIAFPACLIQEADSGETALSLVRISIPDVVLVGFRLRGMNGIETTRQIKAIVPQVKIAIFAVEDGEWYQNQAAAAGADAYILKQKIREDFLPAMGALLL